MEHLITGCTQCPLTFPVHNKVYCGHPDILVYRQYESEIKENDDCDLMTPKWCPLKQESITIKII